MRSLRRVAALALAVVLLAACSDDPKTGSATPAKATRKVAFIRSIDTKTRILDVDFAEFLTGDKAQAAYRTEFGADATLDSDYYVSNPDTDTTRVPLTDDAPIKVNILGGYDPLEDTAITLDRLAALFREKHEEAVASLFWINLDGNRRATSVTQQYVP